MDELLKIIFGTNNVSEINYDEVRFKKIIIIADSDDDGLHITSLMIMAFKEHFIELIKRGYVYIACPPKYRITVNGKHIHFKNDIEYDTYKAEYVSKRYSINNKNLTMLELIQKSEDFRIKFNMLKNKFALPNDILSMILTSDNLLTVAEYLDEQGLEVTEIENDEYYVQGLLEDDWMDVELNKSLVNEIKELYSIFNCNILDITDKKDNITYECDIIDGLDLIDKEFKFTRYRFKGLGETSPDELAITSLNKDTRDIMLVEIDNEDNASDINKILFGNNADLRKDFIQENLSNLERVE